MGKIKRITGSFILMLLLFGCSPTSNQSTKKLKPYTDKGPALYTLKEQKKHLDEYPEFYQNTFLYKDEGKNGGTYPIPGLKQTETLALGTTGKPSVSTTMDPQGVTIAEDYLLISAYSHDKKHNSVIYVLNKETHTFIKTIVLEGKPHAGGITYDPHSQLIWVCSETKGKQAQLVSFSLKDLESYQLSPNYQPIKYRQKITLEDIKRASYISYHDNALFVGYFVREGDTILNEYSLDNTGTMITEVKKHHVVSDAEAFPDEQDEIAHGVQGITFYKDKLLVSQSFGRKNSKIYIYNNKGQTDFKEKDALKVIEAPPYLEQITAVGDTLYVIFESATERFRYEPHTVKVDRVLTLDLSTL